MAEKNLDNELTPNEFYFTSSFECEEGLTVAVERCPLCARTGRPFYCGSCVQNGVFTYSKSVVPERFVDVQRKWEFRNKERLKLVERVKEAVARQAAADAKREEIVACRKRIQLLKSAIENECKNLQKRRTELQERREKIKKRKEGGQKRGHKIQKRQKLVETVTSEIEKKEMIWNMLLKELCEKRLLCITDLADCIFPIEELNNAAGGMSTIGLSSESLALSTTVTALKEASLMTYMSGQWILTDHNGNSFFKIVESRLPGHGDYSAAITKGCQSMVGYGEEEGGVVRPQDNAAYAVLTGLSHMTQLITAMARILHICLPRKLCFREFCEGEMSERQLQSAVSRLNHNVLYLCFSQGVDVSNLSPRHTLRNIVALLHSPNLARNQSFIEDQQMIESVNYGSVSDESDDEADDQHEGETEEIDWVRVDRNLPEMKVPTRGVVATSWTVNTATYAGHMLAETQSTASGLVTSAAASVASFWRAAASRFEKR